MNTDTLRLMNEALSKSFLSPIGDPRFPDALAKSTFAQNGSATSGLTFYDLELGAKFMYPVLTPLRNEIPRVSGKGGIQAAWRAITGINTSGVRIGLNAGNRGAVMAVTTADYTASYKGIGIENNVDFEAQYAGMGFDDIRQIAAKTGLEALMLGEEMMLLGGNTSLALGTTPTPVCSGSITGGTLNGGAGTTYNVVCAALTLEGYMNATIAGGLPLSITRVNADASSDTFGGGTAQKSATASATVSSGTTGSITATVADVKGAVAYGWYWGTAGNEVLGAITTVNAITITATAAGTQNITATGLGSDNSTNTYSFDGLMTQATKSGSNSYYKSLDNATLTADGSGGIVEIDAALKSFWDNYRLTPDTIWVNAQEALYISQKILTGSSTSNLKFQANIVDGIVAGGVMVKEYLNRFSMSGGSTIPVRIHPNMPAGTILFTTSKLPYPMANVSNVFQVRTRQDYYQIEWPLRTRKYEYGVYADQVLQHYFPPSMGMIRNIKAG